MEYLKKYESWKQWLDPLYQKIDYDTFEKYLCDIETIPYSEELQLHDMELTDRKIYIKDSSYINFYNNSNNTFPCKELSILEIDSNGLYGDNKQIFECFKNSDDWYIVRHLYMELAGWWRIYPKPICYYKCDEIYGLISLIQNMCN